MKSTNKNNMERKNETMQANLPNPARRKILIGLVSLAGVKMLSGCDPCGSIIPCKEEFPNGGRVVSKNESMKVGDSLKAGNYELFYAGFSGDASITVFNVKNSSGSIVSNLKVPTGKSRAVEGEECGCSGYTVTVNGFDSSNGTINVEVRTFQ